MKIIYDDFIKKNYKSIIITLFLNILKFKNDYYNIFLQSYCFFFSFYHYIRKFIINNIKTNL